MGILPGSNAPATQKNSYVYGNALKRKITGQTSPEVLKKEIPMEPHIPLL